MTKSTVSVEGQTFDNWKDALAHAARLLNTGKISQREYNDIVTDSKLNGGKDEKEVAKS